MPVINKTKRRPWQEKKEIQDGRKYTNQKFYSSTRWRKIRKMKIDTNPLCQECEMFGRIKVGEVVDHIIPLNKGGEPFVMSNLQTLCHQCHNRKSGREAHQ